MNAAASEAEQALQRLKAADEKFAQAAQTVIRAAFPDKNRQFELEHAIGGARFHELLVRRFRALGLGPLLDQARLDGTVGDAWITEFAARIERNVP